jgi:hypothetical protein
MLRLDVIGASEGLQTASAERRASEGPHRDGGEQNSERRDDHDVHSSSSI